MSAKHSSKGFALFLSAKCKINSPRSRGLEKKVVIPLETLVPNIVTPGTAFTLNHSHYFQSPNDCQATSPTTNNLFCFVVVFFFFVQNVKTIGFEI